MDKAQIKKSKINKLQPHKRIKSKELKASTDNRNEEIRCKYSATKEKHEGAQETFLPKKRCCLSNKPEHFEGYVQRLDSCCKEYVPHLHHKKLEEDEITGRGSVSNVDRKCDVSQVNHSIRHFQVGIRLEVDDTRSTPSDGTGSTVICQLDTGASCSVISYDQYSCLSKSPPLRPTRTVLRGFGGGSIKSVGTVNLKCNKKSVMFHVIKEPCVAILGAQDCLKLGFIKKIFSSEVTNDVQAMLEKYEDCFEGLGCFNQEYDFELQELPKSYPRNETLQTWDPILKKCLRKMEQNGILAKVKERTPWNNCVSTYLKDKDKMRINFDARNLNRVLKVSSSRSSNVEEHFANLAAAKVFSILRVKNKFWQVKLSQKSSLMTAFLTKCGTYRWLRMPHELSTARNEFQKRQYEVLKDLENTMVTVEAVMVYGAGSTEEEAIKDHNQHLENLLRKAREENLKFDKGKSKLNLTKVSYQGFLLTNQGVRANPEKMKKIKSVMPISAKESDELLPLMKHLAKSFPNLSKLYYTLKRRRLQSSSDQEETFDKIKLLMRALTRRRYWQCKAKGPVTLQCSASQYGFGAVLIQEGVPVAFASCSMYFPEQPQIKEKCRAILFGCRRFHEYLRHREIFDVETDQELLLEIFRESVTASEEMQSLVVELGSYNIRFVYKSEREMQIAHCLSNVVLKMIKV